MQAVESTAESVGRSWWRQRWYRSLLVAAVPGAFAYPALIHLLPGLPSWPPSVSSALVIGILLGTLWACLTTSISCLCLTQMSPPVRALLLSVAVAMPLAVMNAFPSQSDLPWRHVGESLLLLCGSLVSAATVNLWQARDGGRKRLTAPRGRSLGFPNEQGDLQLFILVVFTALLLILYHARNELAWDGRDAVAIAAISLAAGLAGPFFYAEAKAGSNDASRWGKGMPRRLLIGVVFATGICIAVTSPSKWQRAMSGTPPSMMIGVAIGATVAWWVVSESFRRLFARSGWRWDLRRHRVTAHQDGRLNLNATDRSRELSVQRGWVTVAGVYVITMLIAAPALLGHRFLESWGNGNSWHYDTFVRDCFSVILPLIAVTSSLAGITSLTLVITHHCRGLIRQTLLLGVTLTSGSLILDLLSGSFSQHDTDSILGNVAVALPLILCTACLKKLSTMAGVFRVGVVTRRHQPIGIRSIMALTLLVGVEIAIVKVMSKQATVESYAMIAGVTGVLVWCYLLTVVTFRRSLGRRTWANFFGQSFFILAPIAAIVPVTIQFGVGDWYIGLAILALAMVVYCLTIGLIVRWLKMQGWKIEAPSRPGPDERRDPVSNDPVRGVAPLH